MLRHLPATSLLCAALIHPEPSEAGSTIDEIRFDWSTYRSLAPGSDIWPLTWCEDDYQYTSWGDGGGFGGTNTDSRVSLGFARIGGSYASMQTLNLWGGHESVMDAEFRGKVKTILCLDGDLYAWRSPGSAERAFEFMQLILSEDKGLTWQEEAFPETYMPGCEGCPGLPYTINYGKNYAANQDGYVYTYWIELQDTSMWAVQIPGVLWLMRAPAANRAFANPANWRWVTGFDSQGRPIWGSQANRVPVLEDPDGMMRGSAIYVPGLGRYLMVQNHTARNAGNIVFWEAPQPWGPWTLIMKDDDWPQSDPEAPVDSRFSFGNFSPKWFSADGRSGVFVWFGPDRWNSAAMQIVPVPEPSRAAAAVAGLLALAACARSPRARRARARAKPPEIPGEDGACHPIASAGPQSGARRRRR